MFRRASSKTLAFMAAALLGFVLLPFVSWVSILVSVLLLALPALFGLGILTRLVVAVITYGAAGAMVLQVASMADTRLSFGLLSAFMLGVSLVYAYLFREKCSLRTSPVDLLGLAVGSVVFIALAIPLFGASTSKTLEYLIPGEDNNSHLQMYHYVLENGGYAFDNQLEAAAIRPSLISYAQGSHGAMAVLTYPFAEKLSPTEQSKVYAFSALAAFSFLFWLSFVFIARALEKIKAWTIQAALGGVLGAVFVIAAPLGLFLSLYTYGYYPQVSAYLGLVFLLLIVFSRQSDRRQAPAMLMAEVCALLVGMYVVFASWYLLSPVAGMVVLGYLWANRKQLLQYKLRIGLVVLPVALLFVYLLYIYLAKSTGASHILTTGGVEKLPWWTLAVAVPAVATAVMTIMKKQWYLVAISISVIVAAGFSAAVGYYQKLELHHFDYYFYKTLFTVAIIAVLYYGYLLVSWIGAALANLNLKAVRPHTAPMLLSAAGCMVLCAAFFVFNPPKYWGMYMKANFETPEQAPNRLLDTYMDNSLYSRYSDVFALNHCNPYTNFTGTIWAGGFFLSYTPEREKLERELLSRVPELSDPASGLWADLGYYASLKEKPVAFIAGSDCLSVDLVRQAAQGKNITLISPDAQPL